MVDSLVERIIQIIGHASDLYHRLVILTSPSGSGKTVAFQEITKRITAPSINVNLKLSSLLLDLTERQRSLRLPNLLAEIVESFDSHVILLDNIELLFDVSLKQDPLRLLQGLSRNKTVVAAWSGEIDSDHIIYAKPEHIEYKRYPVRDFLVVS